MNATAPALRRLAGPLATLAGSGGEFAGGVCKLAGRSNGFAGSARELADSPHTLADRDDELADSSDVFADRGCQLAASPRTLADRDRELVGSSRTFTGSPREMVGPACHFAAPPRQPAECPRQLADRAGKPPKQVVLFRKVEPYPGHSCPAAHPSSSRGARWLLCWRGLRALRLPRRPCHAALLSKVEQVFNLFALPYSGHSCPATCPGSSRGARWLLCWRGLRALGLPRRPCHTALPKVEQVFNLFASRSGVPYPGHSCPAARPGSSRGARWLLCWRGFRALRLPRRQCNAALHSQSPLLIRSRLTLVSPFGLRCAQSVSPVATGLGSKSPRLKVSPFRGAAALSQSRGAAAFSQSPRLKVSQSRGAAALAALPHSRRIV